MSHYADELSECDNFILLIRISYVFAPDTKQIGFYANDAYFQLD